VIEFRILRTGMDSNYVLGGGLEPLFRVLFSALFQVFPWGISIGVEICGK
jgi:hypothetical protein